MELPEYVTIEEVKRVCKELDIRDWTELTEPAVLPDEARLILSEIKSCYRRLAKARIALRQAELDRLG